MSASAPKTSQHRLMITLSMVVTFIVTGCLDSSYGQTSVPAAQVVQMVAQVKAAPASESILLNAVPLAEKLLVEERYSEAAELLTALLDKWPREPAVLYGAALAAFNLGNSGKAEALVRKAVEIYLPGINKVTAKPLTGDLRLRGANALVLLAVILGARGADTEALNTVQRAVTLAPEHYDAQFTLGRALYSVGDSAAAVKAFRAALALKPDDAKSLFFLATALETSGDTTAALSVYRELSQRQPEASEGHLGLGVLLIRRGGSDVEKGIQELKIAVRINPNLYEAQVTLGRALLMQKLAQESVEHLQRAAALAPDNPEPHYQLAVAYRRLGLNTKALEETAAVKRIHEARRGAGAQNSGATRPEQ